MKCAKCGKEITNLPEYFSAISAELLCKDCIGCHKQAESPISMLVGLKNEIPSEILPHDISDANVDEAA